jgi:hypothetical protein
MGTFAETAIINYCLLFADQGKQTYGNFSLFLWVCNTESSPTLTSPNPHHCYCKAGF